MVKYDVRISVLRVGEVLHLGSQNWHAGVNIGPSVALSVNHFGGSVEAFVDTYNLAANDVFGARRELAEVYHANRAAAGSGDKAPAQAAQDHQQDLFIRFVASFAPLLSSPTIHSPIRAMRCLAGLRPLANIHAAILALTGETQSPAACVANGMAAEASSSCFTQLMRRLRLSSLPTCICKTSPFISRRSTKEVSSLPSVVEARKW